MAWVRSKRWVLLAGSVVLIAAIVSTVPWLVERFNPRSADPSIWLDRLPDQVGPRSDDLTLNVSGILGPEQRAEWQWNEGEWSPVGQAQPRAPAPEFIIEIPADQIAAGTTNTLGLRIGRQNGETTQYEHRFNVGSDSTPGAMVPEPHDGVWDWQPDLSAVRPRPGHEGYDRVFILNPQISGGRHLRVKIAFDKSTQRWTHRLRYGPQYGFGLVPLWGGHPDPEDVRPRRGWLYGLAWYYAREEGFGSEAANRSGGDPIEVVKQYGGWSPAADSGIDAYATPVKSEQGDFLGWCLVSVLSSSDGDIRPAPLFVDPAILPERDYAAALIAHRTAVTFSEISWQPLDPLIAAGGSGAQACETYRPGG